MTIRSIAVCSLFMFLSAGNLGAAYKKYALKPDEDAPKGVTYFTDNNRYAVTLSRKDIRTIEFIMKRWIGSSDNNPKYNQSIDEGFIRRITGGCGHCGSGECTGRTCSDCSDDAILLKQVLSDFKGQNVDNLFNKLGLRREI